MEVARSVFNHTFINPTNKAAIRERGIRAGEHMKAWIDDEIARRDPRRSRRGHDRAAARPGHARQGRGAADDRRHVRRRDRHDHHLRRQARQAGLAQSGHRVRDAPRPRRSPPPLRLVPRRAAAVAAQSGRPAQRPRRHRDSPEWRSRRGDSTVAWTQAAMQDSSIVEDPRRVRPDRDRSIYLHFGGGLHPCAGRAVNRFQIPLAGRRAGPARPGPGRRDRLGRPVPAPAAGDAEGRAALMDSLITIVAADSRLRRPRVRRGDRRARQSLPRAAARGARPARRGRRRHPFHEPPRHSRRRTAATRISSSNSPPTASERRRWSGSSRRSAPISSRSSAWRATGATMSACSTICAPTGSRSARACSDLPGLCFAGTPGMSVGRIRGEAALARFVAPLIDDGRRRHAADRPAGRGARGGRGRAATMAWALEPPPPPRPRPNAPNLLGLIAALAGPFFRALYVAVRAASLAGARARPDPADLRAGDLALGAAAGGRRASIDADVLAGARASSISRCASRRRTTGSITRAPDPATLARDQPARESLRPEPHGLDHRAQAGAGALAHPPTRLLVIGKLDARKSIRAGFLGGICDHPRRALGHPSRHPPARLLLQLRRQLGKLSRGFHHRGA